MLSSHLQNLITLRRPSEISTSASSHHSLSKGAITGITTSCVSVWSFVCRKTKRNAADKSTTNDSSLSDFEFEPIRAPTSGLFEMPCPEPQELHGESHYRQELVGTPPSDFKTFTWDNSLQTDLKRARSIGVKGIKGNGSLRRELTGPNSADLEAFRADEKLLNEFIRTLSGEPTGFDNNDKPLPELPEYTQTIVHELAAPTSEVEISPSAKSPHLVTFFDFD